MADEKNAEKPADTTDRKVKVEFGGKTYQIAELDDWPALVIEMVEDARYVNVLRFVLGQEQFAQFIATEPKKKDVDGFVQALQTAAQGN